MSDDNEVFSGINDALDTNFESSSLEKLEGELEQKMNELELKKGDLVSSNLTVDDITQNDIEFLTNETKFILMQHKQVINTLNKELKQGASPRLYEVYAEITKAAYMGIKELVQFLKAINDIQHKKDKIKNPTGKITNHFHLSGNAVLKMVQEAEKNNQMNSISADYQIIEDEDDDEGVES